MSRRWIQTALAAVLAIAIVGVAAFSLGRVDAQTSPSASPAASPGASPAASPMAGGFEIDMVDIKFQPRTLTIPANTAVTITLPNKGAAVHNFNIDELNIHSGDVQPGASGSVTINAAPGKYTFYCSIPGHRDAGMVGQITVQ